MSLPLKFGATGLLFLLHLVLLLLDFQSEINRGIRVAEMEREGVAYGRPLTALILDVSQGGRSIEGDLRAVDRADSEYGDALGVRADWRRVRAEGKGIEAAGPGRGGEARDLFCGHLIALLTTVGNNSNLILDPDMDSYYTMDTVLTQMPQLVTNVSQARAVADGAGAPGVRRARLAMLVGQIQTPVAAAGDDLRMATGYDQALAPRVVPPFQDLRGRTASFTGLLNRFALDRFGAAPGFYPEIDGAGDAVFESGRRYDRAGFSALDQVLARRLHTSLARRTRVDIVAAVSTCLAVAFFCGLYRTTMRTIHQIAEAQMDLTEHRRLEQQLAHQAFHDALTGLPNRALFLDRLEHALARAERGRSSVAVLFVDLDNFKVVNDSLGHAAGDALLCAAAQRLSGCIRPSDTLARLGGDEFTILLENAGRVEAATEVGARIADALRRPFVVQEHTLFVSASVGVAWDGRADGDARPARSGDLLREADIAMYQAKNGGKARCAVFNQRMNAEAMERLELEGELRHAIAQGELVLHYQPIVSLETGALQEVEALVRWEHPRRGLIPPLRFIPVAEETGLIVPLGLWVLREACRQTRQWQREHPRQPPLVVGVNLSARQMEQPDLVAQVSAVLAETGLPADCLKLEITETVMMGNAAGMVLRMRRLKALGVHLAVDDFGTGYSSMAYLSAFPLDTLKIDRSFVTKMAEPEGQAILQAIITLAHSLHLQVTSEGIETSDQWHCLQALGCERGQGYFFARPQTSEALAAMLSENASRLAPVPQPA